MNYSFPGVSFEPDFHLAWKDAQLSLPAFQGFIWFTSMTLVDFSFCMSSGRNSPLFSYRWLRYMKLWTSHYTFVEFLFLIAEAIFFLVKKKKRNYFQVHENMLQIPVMTGQLTLLQDTKQSEKYWKLNCSNIINSEVKGATGLLSEWREKTALMLGQYLIFFLNQKFKNRAFYSIPSEIFPHDFKLSNLEHLFLFFL